LKSDLSEDYNGQSRGELVSLFSLLDNFMEYCETPMYQGEDEIIGGWFQKLTEK